MKVSQRSLMIPPDFTDKLPLDQIAALDSTK